MKILWLSNGILSAQDTSGTGTWLNTMAQGLIHYGEVELGNIAVGNVHEIIRHDFGSIKQWIIPSGSESTLNGLPPQKTIVSIVKAAEEFSPDLIHVWGTEGFWGLLTARKLFQGSILLEMQGLKTAIADLYAGGLSFREQLACIGPKELIRQTTIFQVKRKFKSWGVFEKEIILGHRYISAHSEWMKAKVKAINPTAQIFRNERMIRDPFYNNRAWTFSGSPIIFCSASYPAPFKGIHVAIRSLAILKERFPDISLRIAGPHQRSGIRSEGYIAWINREIRRLDIGSNVTWLGSLSANQLVNEFHQCSAFVLPTFIESYCVALVESMILGVPSVVSFTGGTSYLAKDEDTALFFPMGDAEMCAYQLERILVDPLLATSLSHKAREAALLRNNREKIIQNQIDIYRQVLLSV